MTDSAEVHPSERDYRSVYAAMAELRDRGWCSTTPNNRTEGWEHLVANIEAGPPQHFWSHRLGMRIFLSGLLDRQWLAMAWPLLSVDVRSFRQQELDMIDDRFRECTHWAETAWNEFFDPAAPSDAWWWRRCPILIVDWTPEQASQARALVADRLRTDQL
jgi:hypothetical protein